MATIRKEFTVSTSPEETWAAFKDFGAVHTRLAPGFVVDTRLEEGARMVTFANGLVAKELLVSMEDGARRLVYSIVESPRLSHHNGAFQVFEDGVGARVVWTVDLLPDTVAETVSGMMESGAAAMAKHLS